MEWTISSMLQSCNLDEWIQGGGHDLTCSGWARAPTGTFSLSFPPVVHDVKEK